MSKRVPLLMVVLSGMAILFVALPVAGLIGKAPWSRAHHILTEPPVLMALRLSLIVASISAAVSVIVAFPLAWILARVEMRGKAFVRALVVVPLVMPPVVAGIGLLAAFGRDGLVGTYLYDWFGIEISFSTTAAVMAATFVSFPLAVLALEAGLRGFDEKLEEAAVTMGGSRWFVLRRVTLPMLAPQIAAALVLSWARALGEFGATITFAGNFRGRTQTLPLAVFEQFQSDPDAAFMISILLMGTAFLVIFALRGRFLR